MKGFPNQVADLGKLSQGLSCIVDLLSTGVDPKDDGVFGEALVRAHVLGTGHRPAPVDTYLREQRRKPASDQSHRTSARGLRELYRLFDLIEDTGPDLNVTSNGNRIASLARPTRLSRQLVNVWQNVATNFEHFGGDSTASHPYQVLLQLIARKPGITRALCALALEAKDDSTSELERIVDLAGLSEQDILTRIGVTQSNWDNAKKILPRLAEQFGDVVKRGDQYHLSGSLPFGGSRSSHNSSQGTTLTPAPRNSRVVTPSTIATAGTTERTTSPSPNFVDPLDLARANQLRADRLNRHNVLVRELAAKLYDAGMQLYEGVYDMLAVSLNLAVLVEVKTLDGTADDQRDRVREALAQLLYYDAFNVTRSQTVLPRIKIAFFEGPIDDTHQEWLTASGIATLWKSGPRLRGDAASVASLSRYLEELR